MNTDFNPAMLTLAREVRGLSQQALGEHTGLTWGRVSKLEAGLYPPTDDEIEQLSQALDFPPAFFFREGKRYPVMFICGG